MKRRDPFEDFPVGSDPAPCWVWKGSVRKAHHEPVRVWNTDTGEATTRLDYKGPVPVYNGGRRPFRKLAVLHGVRLADLTLRRPPTCEELCVNPFHRLKTLFAGSPKVETLTDLIRNFLPLAQSEDDIYDEFLLRGHQEEEITLALEKLHENPHT